VRAVLDVNILISAVLVQAGAPAQIMRRWIAGEFELVVSPLLLSELQQTLGYPRLRRRIEADEAAAYVSLLRRAATLARDPEPGARGSPDPADDYLLALAEQERAILVSGDQHLLDLAGGLPILSARALRDRLAAG
jgi:putative PIN family toxin of toxin-antitoxin system